jgi:hypothetical protein
LASRNHLEVDHLGSSGDLSAETVRVAVTVGSVVDDRGGQDAASTTTVRVHRLHGVPGGGRGAATR